jgi:hypothetical protein
MTPYKRIPRRHFADVQFNPYFKSHAFVERTDEAYEKNKKDVSNVFKKLKKIFFRK